MGPHHEHTDVLWITANLANGLRGFPYYWAGVFVLEATVQPSARYLPTAWEAATDQQQVGANRPAPGLPPDEVEDQRKPLESTRTAANTAYEVESGHPCGCPLVPLSESSPGSLQKRKQGNAAKR